MRRTGLKAALRAVGSVKGLARRLGVSPSTMRRWLARGVPKDPEKRARVARVTDLVRASRGRSRAEKATFEELMKLAGEAGKLPSIRTGHGTRSGRLTRGYQTTRRIDRLLDLEGNLLGEIASWAVGVAKHHPLFQLVATISMHAKSREIDLDRRDATGHVYPTIFYKVPHGEAGNFVIDTKVTSHASTVRGEVVADFEDKMWSTLQNGMVDVFVHGVTLFNYRRRTKDEIRLYGAGRRLDVRKRKKRTKKTPVEKPKKRRKKTKKQKKTAHAAGARLRRATPGRVRPGTKKRKKKR